MASRALINRRHGQRVGSTATVSVHVRELAQLFNSLDPAPFWDRDLDRAAAEFIEDEFREKQSAEVWHLHVHVHEGDTSSTDLQQAIESYYGRMANSARLALREHFRLGQLALVGGLVIFLLSMGARGILGTVMGHLPVLLDERSHHPCVVGVVEAGRGAHLRMGTVLPQPSSVRAACRNQGLRPPQFILWRTFASGGNARHSAKLGGVTHGGCE